MRILSYVLAALMVLFAAVQYNDPDGWKWMIIYGIPAVLAVLVGVKSALFDAIALRAFTLLCMVAAVVGVVYYWPKTEKWWLKEVWWEVESAREGMGMMITVIVLALIFLAQHRLRTNRRAI